MPPLLEHRVVAKNTAVEAENKMHDDRVASQFGFRGGLVPGVDVYAYLCHLPAAQWGRAWLEHGSLSARFTSPVYDGDEVAVTGSMADDDELSMTVRSPDGRVSAEGIARLSPPGGTGVEAGEDIPEVTPPDRAERPAASTDTLAAGTLLASTRIGFHGSRTEEYLDDIGEHLGLFRSGDVAHPGWLLRQANYLLTGTVRLGPWIHVSSECQHFGTVVDGEAISTRGRVVDTFERKGHRFVAADVQWITGPRSGERTVMRARHVAITEPRRPATTGS